MSIERNEALSTKNNDINNIKWNHDAQSMSEVLGFPTDEIYQAAIEKHTDGTIENDIIFASMLMIGLREMGRIPGIFMGATINALYPDQDLGKPSLIVELLVRAIQDSDTRTDISRVAEVMGDKSPRGMDKLIDKLIETLKD